MPDLPILIKWFSLGSGVSAVAFGIYQFWLYTTTLHNRKTCMDNAQKIIKIDSTVGVMLERQKTIEKSQEEIKGKIDELISIQMKTKK